VKETARSSDQGTTTKTVISEAVPSRRGKPDPDRRFEKLQALSAESHGTWLAKCNQSVSNATRTRPAQEECKSVTETPFNLARRQIRCNSDCSDEMEGRRHGKEFLRKVTRLIAQMDKPREQAADYKSSELIMTSEELISWIGSKAAFN